MKFVAPAFGSLLLLLAASHTSAETLGCSASDKKSPQLLYSYMQKNGNTPEAFSVSGLGNQNYLLDQQYNLESPQELAETITKSPAYQTAKIVVLIWSYSGWDGAPYAHALEAILHKPVKGFDGPVWWYPDGTAIASHAEKSSMDGVDASNVAQCVTPDGKYHEESECRPLLKTHDASTALFGNLPFVLSCDDVKALSFLADKGDATSNMRLYFFDSFVNTDKKKATDELSKAAFGGDPLANFIVAGIMRDQVPQQTDLYIQFLHRAAEDGNVKAKAELEKLPRQP